MPDLAFCAFLLALPAASFAMGYAWQAWRTAREWRSRHDD